MGQSSHFRLSRRRKATDSAEEISSKSESRNAIAITNAPYDVLEYEPSQSYMAMFGIDKQYHEKYASKSLGAPVNLSCKDTGLLFLTKDLLSEANLDVYTSSDEEDKCTLQGIQESIKNQASRVGPEGMLVLYFCGHGVSIGREEWGLVPCDFDRTPNSVLYPSVILSCLRGCKAKCILLILDCCFSGTMAMKLTNKLDEAKQLPHMYILAAGTANEETLVINSLGYTTFTYFFRIALDKSDAANGIFPLTQIFTDVEECTEALSSLVLKVHNGKLVLKKNKPSLVSTKPRSISTTDSLPQEVGDEISAKTSFIFQFYKRRVNKQLPPAKLSEAAWQWLNELAPEVYRSPLFYLEDKHLFAADYDPDGFLLNAVLTIIVYSVGQIELVNNKEMLAEPNLYLVLFIELMAIFDRVHLNVEITVRHLLYCLPYYFEAVQKNNLNEQPLRDLYKEIYANVKQSNSASDDVVQDADSVEMPRPIMWGDLDEDFQ